MEIDEVCFRAKASTQDGKTVTVAYRWIAAVERGSDRIVYKELPARMVRGAGQGGGGALSAAELESFILPAGRPPLLQPGTVVHTDSAWAYRDLGFYAGND